MKKACLVVSHPYLENRIFDSQNSQLNRDNCLAPFHYLQREFLNKGVELSTQDLIPLDEADYIIYNDMPKTLPKPNWKDKCHLLILESPLVVKNSWEGDRLDHFAKVYSWNDDVTDEKKFIKVNYSFEFPEKIKVSGHRDKLCCLISANKNSDEVNELYSERLKTIDWFQRNSLEDFDLYGIGWDRPARSSLSGKVVNKVLDFFPRLLTFYPVNKYPSYKGMVQSKKSVLENYTFSICYENIHGLKGYITEKIFDSFFAGCIPIYWGADNITEYIPRNCFIDRREFTSNSELYDYLKSLTDLDCLNFRENIDSFLKSDQAKLFSVNTFAESITTSVLGDS